jgi:ArsR family metal-binding transcriptional regulator
MSYLDSIRLVRTQPCLAEPGKIIIVGQPSHPLDDVLPFLATLPNVIAYNPHTLTLTFRRERGFLTCAREEVYFTQVEDAEHGLDLLSALVDAINAVWDGRADLIAITAPKRALRPLDVWAQLPQTNCKACGAPTCLAFAVGLIQQQFDVSDCTPLAQDAALTDRLATLRSMVG